MNLTLNCDLGFCNCNLRELEKVVTQLFKYLSETKGQDFSTPIFLKWAKLRHKLSLILILQLLVVLGLGIMKSGHFPKHE